MTRRHCSMKSVTLSSLRILLQIPQQGQTLSIV